ncbi:MAG: methylglyoxal synthase [Bacteroidales bacterium]|jgi:methylglyoxal synthase|nr:methylglyoxal synthase [Bacteroidales bacterium]MCI2121646.1 methylglyoxal synthase [Bacteroidales bacterium]MCI2144960.1 methylglyoxal synthase [Bacteroidales bacterium]
MKIKTIALVAHDNNKKDLIEWALFNRETLAKFKLVCTGTTGRLVEEALEGNLEPGEKLDIIRLKSGPLGGDVELSSMISKNEIDMLIFLWDPMQPQPHDVDVRSLLRISNLYNIPTACNRATADFMISSPLLKEEYARKLKDYSQYLNRKI